MTIAGLDAADFFPEDLTTPAAVQIIGGASYDIRGIFRSSREEMPLGTFGVESADISFTAPTEWMPGIVHDSELDISGTTYVVRDVENDAAGVTTLTLAGKL